MAEQIPVDYSQLIPELPEWNNGQGIDINGWLQYSGNYQLAIAFSRLFWPTFAEHDGCVLFSDFSPATYSDFLQSCDGDRASAEAIMNHKHIADLFPQTTVTAAQLIYLGKILKDIYATKLKHDFPNRQFTVYFDEGPLEDLIDYQVTFWQPANESGR